MLHIFIYIGILTRLQKGFSNKQSRSSKAISSNQLFSSAPKNVFWRHKLKDTFSILPI